MSNEDFPTARSAGFHMPPEWHPHDRCWMAWPHRDVVFGDKLARSQQIYADVANAIAAFEPVTMLAAPAAAEHCRSMLRGDVTVLALEIDDSWARDSGPNFVISPDGELAASTFHFNAWGQKHTPWGKDAAVGHRVAEFLGIRTFTSTIYMEGGNVNVDGEGTILATEQCVLNPNRNPGLGKDEAADILCDALGGTQVVWVPGDEEDTETDGHIDGIACFIEPGKVLVEICPDPGIPRYDILQANLEAIRNAVDTSGRHFEIETIEEALEAERPTDIFAMSYINYYVANDAIIMPSFGIDRDAEARSTLASLYPEREIVQIGISDIAIGGGGIHCITQQQPATSKE